MRAGTGMTPLSGGETTRETDPHAVSEISTPTGPIGPWRETETAHDIFGDFT